MLVNTSLVIVIISINQIKKKNHTRRGAGALFVIIRLQYLINNT